MVNCGCFAAKGRSPRGLEMSPEHQQQVCLCQREMIINKEIRQSVLQDVYSSQNTATRVMSLSFRWQHQRVSAQPAILPDLHRSVEHLHHVLHDPVSGCLLVDDGQVMVNSQRITGNVFVYLLLATNAQWIHPTECTAEDSRLIETTVYRTVHSCFRKLLSGFTNETTYLWPMFEDVCLQ